MLDCAVYGWRNGQSHLCLQVRALAAVYGVEPRACGRTGQTLFKTPRISPLTSEGQAQVRHKDPLLPSTSIVVPTCLQQLKGHALLGNKHPPQDDCIKGPLGWHIPWLWLWRFRILAVMQPGILVKADAMTTNGCGAGGAIAGVQRAARQAHTGAETRAGGSHAQQPSGADAAHKGGQQGQPHAAADGLERGQRPGRQPPGPHRAHPHAPGPAQAGPRPMSDVAATETHISQLDLELSKLD